MSSCTLHVNYLCRSLTPSAISCSSLLGYIGDKQVLSLQRYGCINRGIIQHEVLHALGFYHEHTRSDRDQYVRINWKNINKRKNLTSSAIDSDSFIYWLLICLFFLPANRFCKQLQKDGHGQSQHSI